MRDDVLHNAEPVLYLAAGYLFFLPVVGSEPIRRRLPPAGRYLMLLAVMPVDTAVGVILMLLPHDPFPAYASSRGWGPSPLADLHTGGTIMWAGGDLIMTVIALAVAVTLVRDRHQADDDALLAAYNARLSALGQVNVSPKGQAGPSRMGLPRR